MILYPNDRKLLRFLRDKQSNERSFFFISNDYTFCIPIDKLKDSTLSQEAISELRHYNFPLEPPEVEGSLIALESNGCLYHPGGQYVRITSYGWRCAYLSRVTIVDYFIRGIVCPILVSSITTVITYFILAFLG